MRFVFGDTPCQMVASPLCHWIAKVCKTPDRFGIIASTVAYFLAEMPGCARSLRSRHRRSAAVVELLSFRARPDSLCPCARLLGCQLCHYARHVNCRRSRRLYDRLAQLRIVCKRASRGTRPRAVPPAISPSTPAARRRRSHLPTLSYFPDVAKYKRPRTLSRALGCRRRRGLLARQPAAVEGDWERGVWLAFRHAGNGRCRRVPGPAV